MVSFTMDVESKASEIRDSVVLKHKRVTQERVEKYLSATYFTDVNLRGRYVKRMVAIDDHFLTKFTCDLIMTLKNAVQD